MNVNKGNWLVHVIIIVRVSYLVWLWLWKVVLFGLGLERWFHFLSKRKWKVYLFSKPDIPLVLLMNSEFPLLLRIYSELNLRVMDSVM